MINKQRYDEATKRADVKIMAAIQDMYDAASHASNTSNAYDHAMYVIQQLRRLGRCAEPMADHNFVRQARTPEDWSDV